MAGNEAIASSEKYKHSKDGFFMEQAKLESKKSNNKCTRVGAIIVSNGGVVSRGYNIFPEGVSHKAGPQGIQHAEVNAIIKCKPEDRKGAKMYITSPTCRACAKYIIGSGIKEVIYDCSKQKKNPEQRQAEKILTCKGSNIMYREIEQ